MRAPVASAASWCAQIHAVDELRLAGQVDVIGAGRSAGGDEGLAVLQVRADGGDQHPRRLGDPTDRARVGDVDLENVGLAGSRCVEPVADRLELGAVASGERPAQAGRAVPARYSAVSPPVNPEAPTSTTSYARSVSVRVRCGHEPTP